jgi:hypothetical protein
MIACAWCGEPIASGAGAMIPHYDGEGMEPQGMHDECFTRMVVGGLNHLRGACTCHGGSETPDPPNLTKREAAIAAAAFYEGLRQR